jgi:hypothetical protein
MEVLADRCANRLLPGIRAAAIRVEQPFSGLPGMLLVEGRQPKLLRGIERASKNQALLVPATLTMVFLRGCGDALTLAT